MKLSLIGALAAVAVASSGFGQVKINDTVSLTGWATGSYQYTSPSPGASFDSFNLDAAMLSAIITPPKTPLTATLSALYRPAGEGGVSPSGSEVTLLDAYVSYAASSTVTVSAGKFLSYLGYESFYFDLDNMISLANQQLLAPIPGYHEGVKLDFQPDKTDVMGVAVIDSLYQKPGYNATEGDGEFKHSAGFEAYYQNTSINNLTIWAGIGYETLTKPGVDTGGVAAPQGSTVTVYDLWAAYVLDKNGDQIAAEEIYKSGGTGNKGSDWLTYFQYNFDPKTYCWFGISGEDVTGGARYIKYSISPTYNLTANLAVRAQYSYTSYSSFAINSANYGAVEMIVKF